METNTKTYQTLEFFCDTKKFEEVKKMSLQEIYKVLSSYDLKKIERELGLSLDNLGNVFSLAGIGFDDLGPAEKAKDYKEVSAVLGLE